MPLSKGDHLGPYKIVEPIGAGGMGEVFRATDTRLNRDVAIKISSAEFTERFAREARAVAALNHPHVCTLHDVGPNYLVMELIDGKPLKGPLPLDQVLDYAGQIAAALDHAHRNGIVHRDLKPANILLTRNGVKLLDFGLAKIQPVVAQGAETVTSALTGEGAILGTIQYMAPEQLEGREADARSDIFSFGCVLYELLTGRRAFEGQSPAALIASILEKQPAAVEPEPLNRLIAGCLAKDPDDRWQSARDLRHALHWAASPSTSRPPPRSGPWLPWTAAATALIIAAVFASLWLLRPVPQSASATFGIEPPPGAYFNFLITATAVSPDGRFVVFRAGGGDSIPSLWLRPLDSLAARPLPGTEGADNPFWSPDSRWIGFFAQDKLRKIDSTGGMPQTLCDVKADTGAFGGAWNRQGFILFGDSRGLLRVSDAGGDPTRLIASDPARGQGAFGYPQFLSDGNRFIYLASSSQPATEGIYASSLDSPQKTVQLLRSRTKAVYVPPAAGRPARLLFLRDRNLLAQTLDESSLRLQGEPALVAEDLAVLPARGGASFWASLNGLLVYRTGFALEKVKLTWIGRDGRRLGEAAPDGPFATLRISADGSRAAISRRDPAGLSDLWVLDFSRSTLTRLTFDQHVETRPAWSPDGAQIAFSTDRHGGYQIYRRDAGGAGREERLTESAGNAYLMDWSRDGRLLIYGEGAPGATDIYALPLQGPRTPFPVVVTPFDEVDGQISPDGLWVAYSSNEAGPNQIYVQPLPGPAQNRRGKWQISSQGGRTPRWRADGRELFYLSSEGRSVHAADIRTTPAGLQAGVPRELFKITTPRDIGDNPSPYDVSPDGRRFLVEEIATATLGSAPLTVVLNWQSRLKP